ncbi:MAG TPA: MlaD family protein, partial [Phnomibacter sp.]|nr:MlaD family protein [Phnomibacter sp.]
MAFSVNNETKIGALTAITITLFILGFNFLKGKSPLKGSTYLYARFEDIADLKPANPVMMNGLAVGKVYETAPGDAQMNTVLVTIRLTEKILIPTNSIATIKGNPLGTPAVEITKGDAQTFLKKGDTLQTGANGGLLGTVMEKLGPTQKSLENALGGMDTLLQKVNGTLTPSVQQDLQATISHLAITTAKLSATVDAVNKLVASQNATIANTLKNAETFSSGLAETKGKLPAITNNLETATQKLSSLELDKTINQLNKTMAALD